MSNDEFNQAAASPPKPSDPPKMVAQPVSKVQIEGMLKQLSTPKIAADFTPQGTVTKQVRTEKDKEILKKVEEMQKRLSDRRNGAKEGFGRAHENKTIKL